MVITRSNGKVIIINKIKSSITKVFKTEQVHLINQLLITKSNHLSGIMKNQKHIQQPQVATNQHFPKGIYINSTIKIPMEIIILIRDLDLDITKFKVTMHSMGLLPIFNSQTQIKSIQNSNTTKLHLNLKKGHLLDLTLVIFKLLILMLIYKSFSQACPLVD